MRSMRSLGMGVTSMGTDERKSVGQEIVEAAENELARRPAEQTPGCTCLEIMLLWGFPVICPACDKAMAERAKRDGWTYGGGV
jgi:hypothetical protein